MDRPLDPAIPARQRRRRLALGGTAVCVAVGAYAWLPALVGPSVSRERIRTAVVERGVVDATIAATGVVVPAVEQVIASPVEARVLRVLERPGAKVSAGQPIVELDVSQARLDVEKLAQDLAIKANAQSQKRLALEKSLIDLDSRTEVKQLELASNQQQLERDRKLASQGLLSVEQLKKSELAAAQSEIELKQITSERANAQQATRAELEGLDLEIGKLRKEEAEAARQLTLASARAGRDGILTWVVTEEGAVVTRGQALARVADFTSFRVDASVSDVHARRLAPGEPAVVKVGADALAGQISALNPTVSNGVITAAIALAQPTSPLLRSNLRVDVEIVTARRPETLRVRRGPFTTGEGSQPVFVVRGDRLERRMATFGLSSVEYFEVLDGLQPGDEIVVSDMRDYVSVPQVRLKP